MQGKRYKIAPPNLISLVQEIKPSVKLIMQNTVKELDQRVEQYENNKSLME